MKLTEPLLKAIYPAKLFNENTAIINSLDFSDTGEFCVTASNDDSMTLYDCISGKKLKLTNSKKYGCESVRFTHSNSCVIHSSNKIDNTIRYLSLHDFRYIRYFNSQNERVLDVVVSPEDDTFVSVENKAIRIWDLRSSTCQGLVQPSSSPSLVRMDPKGLIFAVSTQRKTILLYDIRSFDKGHFFEFSVPISSFYGPPEPIHIETSSICDFNFSPDGQKVITHVINEKETVISVLDSFEGRIYNTLTTLIPWNYLAHIKDPNVCVSKMKINICMTPDSNYFLTFFATKKLEMYLQAWRLDNGASVSLYDPCVNANTCKLKELEDTQYHVTLSKFNPRYMMMATTCDHNLIFWQPDHDKTF